jgi:peroxiredoxin
MRQESPARPEGARPSGDTGRGDVYTDVYTMVVSRVLAVLVLIFLTAPALAAPSAPAFTLKLLDDSGTFDSRALIGKKILVVRFQASWCKVCVEEAAGIERLYEKYRSRGVEVVGVHIQDTAADARRFLKAHEAAYPAGLDPHLAIANRFGFKGTPYTVVVNKKGEMVARIQGRADEARLTRVLDPLVKPPAARKPPTKLQ